MAQQALKLLHFDEQVPREQTFAHSFVCCDDDRQDEGASGRRRSSLPFEHGAFVVIVPRIVGLIFAGLHLLLLIKLLIILLLMLLLHPPLTVLHLRLVLAYAHIRLTHGTLLYQLDYALYLLRSFVDLRV